MSDYARRGLLLLSLIGATALIAAPASAHVTVRPAEVAPEDAVLWSVLVPNEKSAATTSVEIQLPEGVTPFSYVDVPGWKREVITGPGDSVKAIKWTGELAPDGLGVFNFLAAAPAEEGEITWKAIQTYSNGDVVRWIGAPDSDQPAPVTTISASAAPQSGASHASHGHGAESGEDEHAEESGAPSTDAEQAADDGDGSTATVISIVALVVAAISLGLAFVARRRA